MRLECLFGGKFELTWTIEKDTLHNEMELFLLIHSVEHGIVDR